MKNGPLFHFLTMKTNDPLDRAVTRYNEQAENSPLQLSQHPEANALTFEPVAKRDAESEDSGLIREARETLFHRNEGYMASGRVWGVIVPALLRRIDTLEARNDARGAL